MARTCFAELDRLLGDKPYFTGDSVSSPTSCSLRSSISSPSAPRVANLIGGTVGLPAWLDRMLSRPSFVATQPPEMLREAA